MTEPASIGAAARTPAMFDRYNACYAATQTSAVSLAQTSANMSKSAG